MTQTYVAVTVLTAALGVASFIQAAPAQAERYYGCMVAGVFRKDIAKADCLEAQSTGCIRHLLTDQQYKNCIAAQPNNKTYHKIVTKKATQTPDATQSLARANASNAVYKKPNGDSSASNKVCTMHSGDTASVLGAGPDSWVHLGNISGGCGGQSGWVWNAGELTVP